MFETKIVAPLAGAWIEIIIEIKALRLIHVAPLAGAWIEINWLNCARVVYPSRSPRGSVD